MMRLVSIKEEGLAVGGQRLERGAIAASPNHRPLTSNPMRVTDGTRTRDVQDHNLALYQLSYGHRLNQRRFYRIADCSQYMAHGGRPSFSARKVQNQFEPQRRRGA